MLAGSRFLVSQSVLRFTRLTKLVSVQHAQTRLVQSLVKRRPSVHEQAALKPGGGWSVTAFKISEELGLEGAQKLLVASGRYWPVNLPEDIGDEAILLKANSTARETPEDAPSRPFNDVFLFRNGSLVFWGVSPEEQANITQAVTPFTIKSHPKEFIVGEREHLVYRFSPNTEKTRLNREIINIPNERDPASLNLDRFTISHAVALSLRLALSEIILDRYVESISWITDSMKRGDSIQLSRKEVFRKTGEIFELRHRIILDSDLLDLPDVYWDRPEQENLFLSLASHLNVAKRTAVISQKLDNCSELMSFLVSHMNDRHHIRLEWMIIVLIMVEVLFEFARFGLV